MSIYPEVLSDSVSSSSSTAAAGNRFIVEFTGPPVVPVTTAVVQGPQAKLYNVLNKHVLSVMSP